MTGIYYRMKRNDKWENVEIEHLTQDEPIELFKNADNGYLVRVIDVLCGNIRYVEEFIPNEEED